MAADLEGEVRRIAEALHRSAAGKRPAIFEPTDWLRRMIERSLDDEELRTALFRFVDVLPSLRTAREIGDHLEEYFASVDHALGGLTLLAASLHAGWLVAPLVRRNVVALARRFIVEESPAELRAVLVALREEPAAFTLDLVGEATVSESEAVRMHGRYERLLTDLAPEASAWPEVPQIDRDDRGPMPRVNVSIKLSSLCARFDPLDADSERAATERLRELFRAAARYGTALTVDMEQYAFRETTLGIVHALLGEAEFAERPRLAIALQAYLPETDRDLAALAELGRARSRRIGVRLIKGAYWDSEVAWADQKGWRPPVYLDKAETDAAYERLTGALLEAHDVLDPAFGSHNLRSLAFAIARARSLGLPRSAYEIQTLHGMAEPLRRALVESGERVRVYLPVGALIPGMAYLIRRLLENTSNVSFLRQTYGDGVDLARLIAAPRPRVRRQSGREGAGPGFVHEPLRDFSRGAVREAFAGAIRRVRGSLPRRDGASPVGAGELESRNPARVSEVVGRVRAASVDDADRAVSIAREAFDDWRRRPVAERAALLRRAAEVMRRRRDELAALIVLEVGKGWRDADAEVCEAIDYAEYYATEMLRIGAVRPTEAVLGERDEISYEPLGVTTVIAPWNFPLAIASGMTLAALVAGNTVVLKPAEQSPVVAAELRSCLRAAGLPEAACVLACGGGELGAALVRHGDVRAVAFTGSRAVGLDILRAAAAAPVRFVKRVVCEMGGKNAILVDRDADEDEAIAAILESAFGYQGQKCSAASRVIVVGDGYERFVARLAEAARTLRVGPPEDPRNAVGPLIDEDALERVAGAIAEAKRDGRLLAGEEASTDEIRATGGFFVSPAIAADLPPHHRLAQEEIFGPLLLVFAARTFGDALEIANGTPYGLTGGVFSRSPAHLERARREFRVGNLYLNRAITGAVVGRQPFGGLKLSGAGSKAGGPDYLQQFLETRVIAENTLRHGFAPENP